MRSAIWFLTILLLATTLPSNSLATSQNDAGLGVDAGNDSGVANAISPGTYTGTVLYNEGDHEDWFRLVVPCNAATVSFRATSGSLYGGEYTDSGAFIANAQSAGSTITFAPYAGTMRLGFGDSSINSGSASYTFTITLGASSQNDAGTGCDAPQDSSSAFDLALGTYSGLADYNVGDTGDWYRFTPNPCTGFALSFRATSGSLYGGVYRDDGSFVGNAFSSGSPRTIYAMETGPFRTGFGDDSGVGSSAYTFTGANLPGDAGTGCDAPGGSGSAVTVPASGTRSGNLYYSGGDLGDWYRFNVARCAAVSVTIDSTAGSMYAGLYSSSGTLLAQSHQSGDTWTLVGTGGPFLLGLGDNSGSGVASYSFTTSVIAQGLPGACASTGAASPDPLGL